MESPGKVYLQYVQYTSAPFPIALKPLLHNYYNLEGLVCIYTWLQYGTYCLDITRAYTIFLYFAYLTQSPLWNFGQFPYPFQWQMQTYIKCVDNRVCVLCINYVLFLLCIILHAHMCSDHDYVSVNIARLTC